MRLSARLTRIVLDAGVCRDIHFSRSTVNGVTIERHPFHHAGPLSAKIVPEAMTTASEASDSTPNT